MAITQITNYVAEGQGRLLQQFQGKPRIASLIKAWLTEYQEIEDALWAVWIDRVLQNGLATGDLLDKLGFIVGQERAGFSDALYSLLISARIRTNRSNGARTDLIAITSLLVPNAPINIADFPPACVFIQPMGPISVPAPIIGNGFLAGAVSAGVKLVFVSSTFPTATTITAGSVHTTGFANGPPATSTGVASGQSPGSVHHAGFTNGPPCTNDGGGVLCHVIQA